MFGRYVTEVVGRDGNPSDFAWSATPLGAAEAETTAQAIWPRDIVGTIDTEADPELNRWVDLDEAVEEQFGVAV